MKVIKPEFETVNGNVYEVRDILGTTFRYCRENQHIRFTAEGAIKRALDKFHMSDCKP